MIKRAFRIVNILFITLYFFVLIYSDATGSFTPFLSGFGIDSRGNLYLGLDGRIDVWDGSNIIDSVAQKYAQRGYSMTIIDGKYIILGDLDQKIYKLDLAGNLIMTMNTDRNIYDIINEDYTPYFDIHGVKYELKDGILGYSITSNIDGKVTNIYRMSIFYAIVRLLLIPIMLDLTALVFIYIYKKRRYKKLHVNRKVIA